MSAMSDVLKFTFGFLAKKTRRGIAKRLRDSDVTDEECRRLIVRELDDIKSKLDGLARKDLLSSLYFLQEGIIGFYQSLDSNEITAKSTTQATLGKATSSTDTSSDSIIDEAVALAKAMPSLKVPADDHFKSAIESFKLAREKATEAFGNKALSIEDRIQATQIRMMARILEKVKDPNASVSDCLQYLKQLHDIGAIKEIFSVLIDGGIKSPFYITKRLDNASSVQFTNQTLFEFARNFAKLPPRYLDWPMILFGKKCYHAVFGEFALVGKLKKSGAQVVSLIPDLTFDEKICPRLCVVSSKGEILALTQNGRSLKIFKRSAKSRTLCEIPREEYALECDVDVIAMDIDAENQIYLIAKFRKSPEELWSFKLFIFDENGNKKCDPSLPFLPRFRDRIYMGLSKDGKIAILHSVEKTLYIGKPSLEQNLFEVEKFRFLSQLEMENLLYMKIMFIDFNSTQIVAGDWLNIYIYTDNGKLERKIKATREQGFIQSFTMNQVMKRIVVKVKNFSTSDYNLLSFSETGELMDSSNLGSSEWIKTAQLISHPNGPVALVGETGAALLQQ